MGKILRRCSLCKKFSATYLVEDPQLGRLILCYACWKARFGPSPAHGNQPAAQ